MPITLTTPSAPGTPTPVTPPPVTAPLTDEQGWRNAVKGRFDVGQQSYLEAIPDLSYSIGAAKAIGGLQSRSAMDNYLLSQSLATRRGTFDGMEDKYAKTAFDTNSQANQARVADQAAAGITTQFDNLRGQTNRSLARSGVNPASGRALAMNNQMAISQAAASAGAQNKAINDLEVLADSRQRTAIGFGSGLTGQGLSAASMSNGIANSALSAAAAPVTQRLSFAGGLSNLYGDAADGYKGLWQSKNLTAADQARLSAAESASDDADTAALLSAGIKLLTPNDAGKSAAGSIFDTVSGWFS
jgi:hypothetical protein